MGRVSSAKQRLMKAITELIWIGSYGGTTIDQICERAQVKKGSFYYFFESKSALAQEAIQAAWNEHRVLLDRIFSPATPPVERIRRYCAFEYEQQIELKKQYGHVLGCPLCTLGTEVSTQDPELRRTVEEVMDQARAYIETTVRDAHAEGSIQTADVPAKARSVYAYIEGLMSQARIQDNADILREMERGVFDILGIRDSSSLAA